MFRTILYAITNSNILLNEMLIMTTSNSDNIEYLTVP